MTTNFITATKMEKFAKRISKLVSRNLDKTRDLEFNVDSGKFQLTGSPDDLNITITQGEKVKLKMGGIKVGKIKYKIVYKCNIVGMPPVVKEAWGDVSYEGQSITQDSVFQDYISNSINTFSTNGTFNWQDITFTQSIAVKDFQVSVSGVSTPKVKAFSIDNIPFTAPNSQPIGFDLNIDVPSTSIAKKNCKDTNDGQNVDFGIVYETPKLDLDGIGFTFAPQYQSIYVTNLDMGYIFPSIAASIDDVSGDIKDMWNKYVCKPMKDVGIKCPKLKFPKGGATTDQISSAIETSVNEILAATNLSKEIDPLIKRAWNKPVFNKKNADVFSGDIVTCNDLVTAYDQYYPTYHKNKKKHNKSYETTFDSIVDDCQQNYLDGSITSSDYYDCVSQASLTYEAITGQPAPDAPSVV